MNDRHQYDNLIEILLVLYLIIGMMSYSLCRYARYIISLFLQIRVFYKSNILTCSLKKCAVPLCSYIIIVLIGIIFIFLRVSLNNWIDRILPLFSIFGLSWLIIYKEKIRFSRVIEITIKLYKYLAVFIILDAVVFEFFGVGIWKPIEYLSHRYAGPFYDCNYMGMIYAFLLLVFHYNTINKKKSIPTYIIFAIAICLSGSWSAIIIVLGTWIFSKLFTIKHLFYKQILILVVYYGFSLLIFKNETYSTNLFVEILGKFLPYNSEALIAKFESLLIRINTQIQAIDLSFAQLTGYGPRTILQFFNHDTHNSYVAILFETGLLGLLLLLINMPIKRDNKFLDVTSTFVILSALVLDIHYTIIYSFFLLFVVFEPKKQVKSYKYKKKYLQQKPAISVT